MVARGMAKRSSFLIKYVYNQKSFEVVPSIEATIVNDFFLFKNKLRIWTWW